MTRTTTRVTRRKRVETDKPAGRVKAVLDSHKMPSKPTNLNGLKERKGFRFFQELLATRLSSIPGIDAAFVYTDDEGPVHVYSVVADYSVGLYKKLLNCERLIEKELPGVRFDFHVRAHQGRKPIRAVPFGARAVFVR